MEKAIIKTFNGKTPRWGRGCYFSENATLVGDCSLGDDCSVWFSAVLRADNDVSIGHNATVHACTIHDGALIGMGSTVLDGAVVGEGAIVAAGAVVLQHTVIGPNEIWGGVPAKFIKRAAPGQALAYAQSYVEVKEKY